MRAPSLPRMAVSAASVVSSRRVASASDPGRSYANLRIVGPRRCLEDLVYLVHEHLRGGGADEVERPVAEPEAELGARLAQGLAPLAWAIHPQLVLADLPAEVDRILAAGGTRQ